MLFRFECWVFQGMQFGCAYCGVCGVVLHVEWFIQGTLDMFV